MTVSQSVSESVSQWVSESVIQSFSQSVSRPASQPVGGRSISPSFSQSVSQTFHFPVALMNLHQHREQQLPRYQPWATHIVIFEPRKLKWINLIDFLCFQAHLITCLPSTSNTNNMTVVREQCGNWESYWWICCHLLNQHLNIKIMLSECRPECRNIFHQVLTPVMLFLGFFLLNKNIFTSLWDTLSL